MPISPSSPPHKPISPASSSSPPPPLPQQPPSTPAEAKKIATLEAKTSKLSAQIAATEAEIREVERGLKTHDPPALVKNHIRLLHEYNAIRDIGHGLMGLIADKRGCRVVDVLREFEVGEGD